MTHRTATTWTQRVLILDARTAQVRKEARTPDLAAGTDRAEIRDSAALPKADRPSA